MKNRLYTLVPWANFYNFIKKWSNVEFRKVDDLDTGNLSWLTANRWEELDDLEILQFLADLRHFEGKLLIVTDVSYGKKFGPFEIDAVCIQSFVKQYKVDFGECFFNGDVLIVSLDLKLVWIFHHEGIYGLVDLTNFRHRDTSSQL
jgi:hypothetical protein